VVYAGLLGWRFADESMEQRRRAAKSLARLAAKDEDVAYATIDLLVRQMLPLQLAMDSHDVIRASPLSAEEILSMAGALIEYHLGNFEASQSLSPVLAAWEPIQQLSRRRQLPWSASPVRRAFAPHHQRAEVAALENEYVRQWIRWLDGPD
jgi:hypothetical protein